MFIVLQMAQHFFAASCSLLIAGSQTRRPVSQDQATHAVHTAFRLESSLVESFRHSFHISAVQKQVVDMYFNHITCRSANFLDLSRWQAKVNADGRKKQTEKNKISLVRGL